mgnify:CR=1 FL=1
MRLVTSHLWWESLKPRTEKIKVRRKGCNPTEIHIYSHRGNQNIRPVNLWMTPSSQANRVIRKRELRLYQTEEIQTENWRMYVETENCRSVTKVKFKCQDGIFLEI